MLTSYLTGIAAVVVVLMAWVAVQLAWRRVFGESSDDPDALAGRMGCHGCSHTDLCDKRPSGCSDPAEEGRS